MSESKNTVELTFFFTTYVSKKQFEYDPERTTFDLLCHKILEEENIPLELQSYMVIYEGMSDARINGICPPTCRVQTWKDKHPNDILVFAVRIVTDKLLKISYTCPTLRSLLFNSSQFSYIHEVTYYTQPEAMYLTSLLLITFDKTNLASDTRPDITIRDYLPRSIIVRIDQIDKNELYNGIKTKVMDNYRAYKNKTDVLFLEAAYKREWFGCILYDVKQNQFEKKLDEVLHLGINQYGVHLFPTDLTMDYIFFPYSQIAGWYSGNGEVVLNIFEIQLILHLRTKDCEDIVQLLDSYSSILLKEKSEIKRRLLSSKSNNNNNNNYITKDRLNSSSSSGPKFDSPNVLFTERGFAKSNSSLSASSPRSKLTDLPLPSPVDLGLKSPPNPYRDRVHLFSDGKSPELGMSEQLKSIVNSKSFNEIPPLTRELTDSSASSPENNNSNKDNENSDNIEECSIQENTRKSTLDSLPILTESSDTNSPENRCLYSNTEDTEGYIKPRSSSEKENHAAMTIERYWRNHRKRHHTSA